MWFENWPNLDWGNEAPQLREYRECLQKLNIISQNWNLDLLCDWLNQDKELSALIDSLLQEQWLEITDFDWNTDITISLDDMRELLSRENIEISQELFDRYNDIVFRQWENFIMLWSILINESNYSQMSQYEWFSWRINYWTKFINEDPIYAWNYGKLLFQYNINEFKWKVKELNEALVRWDEAKANEILDYIQTNIFWRLEKQLKRIVVNDNSDDLPYWWALSVDFSKLWEYQERIRNWWPNEALEFVSEVLKKPEYVLFHLDWLTTIQDKNWKIRDIDELNNILTSQSNTEEINIFFSENSIVIDWKIIKLPLDFDYTDTIKDIREESYKLFWWLKPDFIRQKFLQEILDSVDPNTLKSVEWENNSIFDTYFDHNWFIADLWRNWKEYTYKGSVVALTSLATLWLWDLALWWVESWALIEAGGIWWMLAKFGLDVSILHTTATATSTVLEWWWISDIQKWLSDPEWWWKTVAFMVIFWAVSKALEKVWWKIIDNWKIDSANMMTKIALNGMNFWVEVWAVLWVEYLVFDGEFTPEEVINATLFVWMLNIRNKVNWYVVMKSPDNKWFRIVSENVELMKVEKAKEVLWIKEWYTWEDVVRAFNERLTTTHPDRWWRVEDFQILVDARDTLKAVAILWWLRNSPERLIENKWVERKLAETDKLDIPWFKDWKYEWKDYKSFDWTEITPEKIANTFRYSVNVMSDALSWLRYAVLSSWSMFLNKFEFKKIPWDIDITMVFEDFVKIMDTFQTNPEFHNFRFSRIDKPNETIPSTNKAELMKLAEMWLLRMDFYVIKDWVWINVEAFPERPWRWLIQLDHMTWMNELIVVWLDWKQTNTLPDSRLAQSYFANMIREIVVDSVYRPEKKLKASIRVNNILEFMNYMWFKDPQDIITWMERAIQEYKESWFNKETWRYEHSDYLDWAIREMELAKLKIQKAIVEYWGWGNTYWEMWWALKELPNFNEFINNTTKLKWILKVLIQKIDNCQSLEQLEIYEKAQKKFKDYVGDNLLYDMRDNKKFAYFVELSIIKSNYIFKIDEKITDKRNELTNNLKSN